MPPKIAPALSHSSLPGFNYFAVWFLLPVLVFLFIGIETKGRTIEELDAALTGPAPAKAAAQ